MDKLIHLIHSYLNFYKHSLCVCVPVREQHTIVFCCAFSPPSTQLQAWRSPTHPNTHTLDSEITHLSSTQGSNFILWLLFLLSPWPVFVRCVLVLFQSQAGQTHHPPASASKKLTLAVVLIHSQMYGNQWPIGTARPTSPLQNVKQSWAFSLRSWISVWAANVSNHWVPACGDHINNVLKVLS